jgi:hypothetical protein
VDKRFACKLICTLRGMDCTLAKSREVLLGLGAEVLVLYSARDWLAKRSESIPIHEPPVFESSEAIWRRSMKLAIAVPVLFTTCFCPLALFSDDKT